MRATSAEKQKNADIKEARMKEYEFSIVASGLDHEADDFVDRFFEAGCDDATIAYSRGSIILSFCREAASLDQAIRSGLDNVRAAGATVERVEPDSIVNLAEIAKRAGLSRQALTNYAHRLRGDDFPRPIARITTESPLWDWPTVATWLVKHGRISAETAADAETFKAANEELEKARAFA